MIVLKASLQDNDYIMYLKGFFKKFSITNYYLSIKCIKDDKEFVHKHTEVENILEKIIFHEEDASDEEIKKFVEIAKKSLKIYLKNHNVEDNAINDLKFELVDINKSIKDIIKWNNGEDIYYFVSSGQKLVF